jgi:diguanylate cyclase (GGDEF)-like protein
MQSTAGERREGGPLHTEAIRVLLVEDNPGDERLTRIALSEDTDRHYQITAADTLAGALRLIQSAAFEVILLDMHLPDSIGLANVKQLALATPRTPIVVMTGLDDDSLAIQVSEHGAQAYLVKGKNEPASLSRAIRCAIARKRFEAVLAKQAYFDSLTGLANRGLFNDRLTHALARAKRTDMRVALMFIDLDNFKTVNDRFGHKVGDELLRAVAEALRGAVRQTDTVARLGGDEFTVLLEPLEDASDADVVARKILDAFHAPITLSGACVQVTLSIGIAVFPEHARKADELVQFADAAMFFAKRGGGNRFRLSGEQSTTESPNRGQSFDATPLDTDATENRSRA